MAASSIQRTPDVTRERVVLLHGSGDSAQAWSAVLPHLAGVPCIALDLPGHGSQVDRPGPASMTVADYADTVRAALAREGIDEACLVGHSLGGAIALRLAVDHPSLVRRLVLVGAGARMRVLPDVLEEAQAAQAAAMRRLVMLGFAPDHATQAEAYYDALWPMAPGMLHRDLSACDGFDMMGELGRVSQPTLILVGEADRLTPPKYARFLAEHLEMAHLVTVPEAGHYVQAESPKAVAGALRDWLAQEQTPVESGAM